MASMQDRVTAELQHITEAAGLKFINNVAWANTGTFYVQQGFETVLNVTYDFQTNYCTLKYAGPAMEAWKRVKWKDGPGARFDHKRINGYVEYDEAGAVQRQADMFTAMLATVVVPVAGRCAYCGRPGTNPGELENFNPASPTNLACRVKSACQRRQVEDRLLAAELEIARELAASIEPGQSFPRNGRVLAAFAEVIVNIDHMLWQLGIDGAQQHPELEG